MRNNLDTHMKSFKICLALFILVIGGLIYIVYRSENLLMFKWFDYLCISDYIMYFRDTCSKYSIPNFIQYSLPDGLWALSYMMIMGTIWDDRNLQKLLLVYTVPLVAITLELSQIFFSTLGTFDILDILSYSMAIIIYQLIQHIT